MSTATPPSPSDPPYRATITASVLDDDEPRGQVVVTTVPVFSEQLAARSELPGETEFADHVDFQRIAVECTGRADLSRTDATRLAAALLHAIIDTMKRGLLRNEDAVALLYEVAELHPTLGHLHRLTLQSARQTASTSPDVTPDTDDLSAS